MLHTHHFFPLDPDRILEAIARPEHGLPATSNLTLVPEELLLQSATVPILTIRHPVLVVPSAFRAMRTVIQTTDFRNMLVITNPIWARWWYDFYETRGIQPIVVDADDYMTSEAFVRYLCEAIGLHGDEAVLEWSTSTTEESEKLTKEHAAVQTTLLRSNGMNKDRAGSNIDFAEERRKWTEEFRADEVETIRELIRLAEPHYHYLYSRRLRA